MTTTKLTAVEIIRASLAHCLAQAEEQADPETWDADSYEYAPGDLEYVCEQLGRKPTKEEWTEAGLAWVGSAHVGEQPEPRSATVAKTIARSTSLEELRDVLAELGKPALADVFLAGELDRAMTDLPTFGGSDLSGLSPIDGGRKSVWSWDERRILVGTGAGDLQIVERSEFGDEGEPADWERVALDDGGSEPGYIRECACGWEAKRGGDPAVFASRDEALAAIRIASEPDHSEAAARAARAHLRAIDWSPSQGMSDADLGLEEAWGGGPDGLSQEDWNQLCREAVRAEAKRRTAADEE